VHTCVRHPPGIIYSFPGIRIVFGRHSLAGRNLSSFPVKKRIPDYYLGDDETDGLLPDAYCLSPEGRMISTLSPVEIPYAVAALPPFMKNSRYPELFTSEYNPLPSACE
jgi:hypothetical protein